MQVHEYDDEQALEAHLSFFSLLPNELLIEIFAHFDGPTRVVGRMVCKWWRQMIPIGTQYPPTSTCCSFMEQSAYLGYKKILT
jgi:hypothetical protein